MSSARVAVVGAGMSGAACARALLDHGVDVTVYERGRAPGGRMASPTVHDRRVDLGAAYFTVGDPEFSAVVSRWVQAGLARPWTDTFDVFSADGRSTTTGPLRYAAPNGLRALVRDVLPDTRTGVPTLETEVTALADLDHDAVVLAMPDPQAARLAPDAARWVDYAPVIAVAAGWPARHWDVDAAAFVNDEPDVSFVADDGSRRGDRAPVLVAHASPDLAREHLDDPERVVAPVLDCVRRLLDLPEPDWTYAHRWTFAKPTGTHGEAPFALVSRDGRPLGLCGDAWCPEGAPRVESAWASGARLGAALARTLSG